MRTIRTARDRIAGSLRVSVVTMAVVAAGLALQPEPVFACSTYGRTFDDVVATSALIVEADVLGRASDGSIRLRAREVFKGSMPPQSVVGTESVPESSCSGKVALEVGDHVVLGFMDPATALEAATVVWWVEPDGTIERTSIVEDTSTTTIEVVRAALGSRLPDTSTTDGVQMSPAGGKGRLPSIPLALVFAATLVLRLGLARMADRRSL